MEEKRTENTKKIFITRLKKPRTIALLSLASILGVGGIAVLNTNQGVSRIGGNESENAIQITANAFPPGTQISYEVLEGGQVLEKGQDKVDPSGQVDLGIPTLSDQNKKTGTLTYKMRVQPAPLTEEDAAQGSKTLDLLFEVQRQTGEMSFSGTGLGEYADITIGSGKKETKRKADWAGRFSENKIGKYSSEKEKDRALTFTIDSAIFKNKKTDREDENPTLKVATIIIPPWQPPWPIFGDENPPGVGDVQSRYSSSMIRATLQLSAVMAQQVTIIGTLIDAKMQLEVQRKMQELQARAHKDYHPSEEICKYGTFIRSVATTESKMEVTKFALDRILMDQYLGVRNNHTAEGNAVVGQNIMNDRFEKTYCDRNNNNAGLDYMCQTGTTAADKARYNKDIDFSKTLEFPLTLNVDFTDGTATPDEEDVISLAQNLYFSQMFEDPKHFKDPDKSILEVNPSLHYNTRSYAAKMNIAHNSFINLVAMKSAAPTGPTGPSLTEDAGWSYMKSMMREFGLTDAEINSYLGDRPSYYAQMEVLTKKIYQSPNFYTNLYDKPVNVERIGIALDAITLMAQRDRYESLLRREMLTSLLVEQALDKEVTNTSVNMFEGMQKGQQ